MRTPLSTPTSTHLSATLPLTSATRKSRHPLAWLERNTLLWVGMLLVLLLVILAAFAPWLAPNDPYKIGIGPSMASPSSDLIMGTDKLGRDLFSRIIYGARTTLLVSLPSIALSMIIGLFLGLIAGFFGGRVDQIIMRILDIFLAFPGLLLAIAVVAVLGPSIPNLIITIAILYTPRMARIARAPVLSMKEREFISAARVSGAGDWRIIRNHILPNILSPVIVDATLSASQAIITESALSYLGLGAPPPTPSWGEMLSSSRQFMTSAPWSALFPGLAIVYATTSFIILGNGLRDLFDPRRRNA